MTILSLRSTIGALTATVVLIVTAITLTITLSVSLDALRSIGRRHASALVDVARLRTSAYVSLPETQVELFTNVSRTSELMLPTDDPTGRTQERVELLSRDVFRLAKFGFDSAATWFTDGNTISVQALAADADHYTDVGFIGDSMQNLTHIQH